MARTAASVASPNALSWALSRRVQQMAADELSLEAIIDEILIRWRVADVGTIERARRFAARSAARTGEYTAVRAEALLALVGRTGLFL